MKIIWILVALMMMPLMAQAEEPGLPPGWRALQLSEMEGTQDYVFRRHGHDWLSLSEDFDGNGFTDAARFLVKDDGSEYALFITMNSRERLVHYKHYGTPSKEEAARLGVMLAEPGEYSTTCGRGYWECSEKEPAKVKLKNPALEFFLFDSAAWLVYWNGKKHAFEEVMVGE